ncbi:MAG TPA: UvrD-helicase domain-containing protein, partial [Candidatus Saccharimonadia bacterium]|nr:UvrD-helicase domain-containing protein [Candidatus Saccharimonadia bacterium]
PAVQRPFEYLIPLPEVIGAALDVGPDSKKVTAIHRKLLEQFGPELGILRAVSPQEVARCGEPLVAEALSRMRTGAVEILAGYDGEYGTIRIFSSTERERLKGQHALFALPATDPGTAQHVAPATHVPPAVALVAESPARAVSGTLDEAQRQVVEAETGPVIVVAGPGAGKTRTLTQRIAYLMRQRGVPSDQMLAVTFTKRAAAEMQSRLRELLSVAQVGNLRIGTFHRLALDLMRLYEAGPPKTVLDALEARHLLDVALHETGLKLRPQVVQQTISLAKAAGLRPADLVGQDQLQTAYTAYQEQLHAYWACDYDDILLDCLTWLDTNGETATQVRQHFPYVLVDEFQDVNAVQYRLVKILAGDGQGLFVIGDPDQAIYGFRGADSQYFRLLTKEFPQACLVQLATNYRSTQTIVRAAGAVIAHNRDRQPLHLQAAGDVGKPLRLYTTPSEVAEGIAVVRQISRMVGGADMIQADQHAQRSANTRSFGDFGVLVRTGQQAEVLEQCFLQEGLPYRLLGHTSFLAARGVRQALAFGRYLLQPTDTLRLLQVLEVEAFQPGKTARAALRQQAQAGVVQLQVLAAAVPSAVAQLQTLAAAVERYRALLPEPPGIFFQRWQEEYGSPEDPELERVIRLAERAASLPELFETILLGQDADYDYTRAKGLAPMESVKVMTLHAAKGLEFPVVFICGMEDGLLPVHTTGAEIAEERRLFYVGLTRAREEVILVRARTRQQHGTRQPSDMSPFVHELPGELLVEEDVEVPRQEKRAMQLSLF